MEMLHCIHNIYIYNTIKCFDVMRRTISIARCVFHTLIMYTNIAFMSTSFRSCALGISNNFLSLDTQPVQ